MMIRRWRLPMAAAMLVPSLAYANDLGPILGNWIGAGLSCSMLEGGETDKKAMISEHLIRFHESECDIRDTTTRGPEFTIKTLCSGEGLTWQEDVIIERRGAQMFINGDGPYVRC